MTPSFGGLFYWSAQGPKSRSSRFHRTGDFQDQGHSKGSRDTDLYLAHARPTIQTIGASQRRSSEGSQARLGLELSVERSGAGHTHGADTSETYIQWGGCTAALRVLILQPSFRERPGAFVLAQGGHNGLRRGSGAVGCGGPPVTHLWWTH